MVQVSDTHTTSENTTTKQTLSSEQDDLRAASQDTTDYSQLMPQLKPKKKWPRVVGWILLGIIVLGGLGAGGYWLVKHHSAAKPKHSTSQQESTAKTAGQTSSGTQKYSSTTLNLSLSYPKGWTVADKGDGKLTVTSPSMQLTDAAGQTQTGQEILTIASKGSSSISSDATAVLASQMLAYAQPTATQQANAYMSFLQYSTTTTKGGLDGIYITGNYGYTYAQVILTSDIAKIDPLIFMTFTKCADAKCSTTSPLTISSDAWKSSSFSAPILAMFKSLQLQ